MRAMARTAPLPAREWNAAGVDPALVIASVLRAHTLLVADLEARFADAGLPTRDVARLLWLWSERTTGLELRAIASKLMLSRPAASRLVDRAERAGLVERSRHILDQREVSVDLTAYGRSAVHRVDAVLRAAAREMRLDENDLDQLAALAARVVRSYDRTQR
jgi:DNA-binding MarR family transcriptional regulator